MSYTLRQCKNGSKTCVINNKLLHSSYNPENEAASFVNNIKTDFNPSLIIIIEPGFSYCAPLLKSKYPDAKIAAVHFTDFFSETDNLWDYVFTYDDNLTQNLLFTLSEELLCNGVFFEWPAVKNIFGEETHDVWMSIKNAVEKATAVLTTRNYFGERWLKNIFQFTGNASNICTINKVNKDIIITASGPSLKGTLPFIKDNRSAFFIIAVSSSLCTLLEHDITPDIVLTTDGGYWAKKHLSIPGYKTDNLTYAVAVQGALPKSLSKKAGIIPLCYEDGIETKLFKYTGIPFMKAVRNGTVSGTAVEYALSITDKNIYLAGLDQCPAKGFQHSQPNALEITNAKKDTRLSTMCSRLTASQINSTPSLEIYRQWFITNSQRLSTRVYRISDGYKFDYKLGQIKDISVNQIKTNLNTDFDKQDLYIKHKTQDKDEILNKTKSFIRSLSEDIEFIKEFLPLDYLLSIRNPEKGKDDLNKKVIKLTQSLEKLIQKT